MSEELPEDPRKTAKTTQVVIERGPGGGANLHLFVDGQDDEINLEVQLNRDETRRLRNALDDALGEDD